MALSDDGLMFLVKVTLTWIWPLALGAIRTLGRGLTEVTSGGVVSSSMVVRAPLEA